MSSELMRQVALPFDRVGQFYNAKTGGSQWPTRTIREKN